MNVLFTCAGRRSYIIKAFKDAGKGRVFACDASGDAPALREADARFITPRVDDPGYVGALLGLCKEQGVDVLIPALEPELSLLAGNRGRFLSVGTLPLVSSPEVVAICQDKLESARLLREWGIDVPTSHLSPEEALEAVSRGEMRFPLLLKPRFGVSSIGIEVACDEEELRLAYRLLQLRIARGDWSAVGAGDSSVLIQERLGGQEYGLDIVNDLQGGHVCTFAKRKLRMHAGQTDRAETVKDRELERLGRRIGEGLRHAGILDCDVLATEEGFSVLDLNPRIGGGYPYSHIAGANFPDILAAWMTGSLPDPAWFEVEPGVRAGRADHYVLLETAATAPSKNQEFNQQKI